MTGAFVQRNTLENLSWLINDFVASTHGVSHALLASSDGMRLLASTGLDKDLADPLSAAVSGLLSLATDIGIRMNRGSAQQLLLRLEHGYFLFMRIGELAGLAVLVDADANTGAAAHQMTELVTRVGHVLTPQLRDELRSYAHDAGRTP